MLPVGAPALNSRTVAFGGEVPETDEAVTLVTANETVTLPRKEVQSLTESQLSMMPEELLQPFNDQEVRDLIYYLRGPAQAPLPASARRNLRKWSGVSRHCHPASSKRG